MTRIFGVNIAKELRKAIKAAGGLPSTATLVKVTPGVRNPLDLGAGTNPTITSYPVDAFVDDTELLSQGQTEPDAGYLRKTRRTVTILGDSLPSGVVPAANDRVTLRGTTYAIVAGKVDPADAAYECTVRGGGV